MSAHGQEPRPDFAGISPSWLSECCQISRVLGVFSEQLGSSFLPLPPSLPPSPQGTPASEMGPGLSSHVQQSKLPGKVLTWHKVTPHGVWFLGAYGFTLNISHFSSVTFATVPPHVLPSGCLVRLFPRVRTRWPSGKGKKREKISGAFWGLKKNVK